MTSAATPTDTVIIGAGAAGLAVAGVLGRRKVPYVLLDQADSLGASWRSRYASLHLHTARALSGLPGSAIPRRLGPWVSRDDFAGYLATYARQHGIEPELGVTVTGLERTGDGWRLSTSAGDREARHVVVATGFCRTPVVPDWPGVTTFVGDLIHSSAYREPSPYAGQDVLVVGSGNSATEIAVDLLGVARSVTLSVRTPPNIVRRAVLGVPSQLIGISISGLPAVITNPLTGLFRRISVPDLTPYGLPAPGRAMTQFARTQTVPILDHGFVAAVTDDRIRVVPAVEAFVGDEVRLADHTIRYPDAVIAATGYRPDLGGLLGGLGVLDDAGLPLVHGAATAPTAPGLHLVGISVQLSGQLRQITREAEQVARAIAG